MQIKWWSGVGIAMAFAISGTAMASTVPRILPAPLQAKGSAGQTVTLPISWTPVSDAVHLFSAQNAMGGGLTYSTAQFGTSSITPSVNSGFFPSTLQVLGSGTSDLVIHIPASASPGLYVAGVGISVPSGEMQSPSQTVGVRIRTVTRVVDPVQITVQGHLSTPHAIRLLSPIKVSTAQGIASIIRVWNPNHATVAPSTPLRVTWIWQGHAIAHQQVSFTTLIPDAVAESAPLTWPVQVQAGVYHVVVQGWHQSQTERVDLTSHQATNSNTVSSATVAVPSEHWWTSPVAIIGAVCIVLALLVLVRWRR